MSVCLRPYIVNLNTHKYLTKIECTYLASTVKGNAGPHSLGTRLNAGLLLECIVGNRNRDGSSWSRYGTLFVTEATDQPSTAGSRTARKLYTWFEIASGKARTCTALINASNSADDFSVKLSLFMCSHTVAACSGSPPYQVSYVPTHVQHILWQVYLLCIPEYRGGWKLVISDARESSNY